MNKNRLTHLLRLSRRRPRLTWRDLPNLLALGAVAWLWAGLGWVVMAWAWGIMR